MYCPQFCTLVDALKIVFYRPTLQRLVKMSHGLMMPETGTSLSIVSAPLFLSPGRLRKGFQVGVAGSPGGVQAALDASGFERFRFGVSTRVGS